jgi:hypothetical protein
MMMYRLNKPPSFDFPTMVYRISDKTYIPFDPENKDYQEYLKWLAEGNEPEPADET